MRARGREPLSRHASQVCSEQVSVGRAREEGLWDWTGPAPVGTPHISCLCGKLERWVLRNLASLESVQVKAVLSLGPLGGRRRRVLLRFGSDTVRSPLNLAPGLA